MRSVRAASSCSTRDAVAGGLVGDDVDRHTAREPDRLGVGGPVRRRDDDLVARVEDRGERLVDRLLAAVGHQDLGRLDLVAGVAQRLRGDRGLELGQPAGRRVAVVLRVAAGLDRGLDDVVGRREVGLAGAEADHRTSGGLEGLGLGVHGEGRGLGDRADAGGDPAVGGGRSEELQRSWTAIVADPAGGAPRLHGYSQAGAGAGTRRGARTLLFDARPRSTYTHRRWPSQLAPARALRAADRMR